MTAPRTPRRSRRPSLAAVVVLTLVWVLLWDRPTGLVIVSGVVLALVVGWVFPLPRIDLHGRIRPLGLLRLAGRLLVDLVVSSLAVVRLALRFGHTPRSAIVRVRLRSHHDLYLSQTVELVSLVPGSIVVEVHRRSSTIYLHLLDAVTDADVERARADVLAAEARVIRAFGSAEEIAALDLPVPDQGVRS